MKKVIVLSAAFVALSLTSCGEKKTEPTVEPVDTTATAPATEEATAPTADTAAPTADTAAPAAPATEATPAH